MTVISDSKLSDIVSFYEQCEQGSALKNKVIDVFVTDYVRALSVSSVGCDDILQKALDHVEQWVIEAEDFHYALFDHFLVLPIKNKLPKQNPSYLPLNAKGTHGLLSLVKDDLSEELKELDYSLKRIKQKLRSISVSTPRLNSHKSHSEYSNSQGRSQELLVERKKLLGKTETTKKSLENIQHYLGMSEEPSDIAFSEIFPNLNRYFYDDNTACRTPDVDLSINNIHEYFESIASEIDEPIVVKCFALVLVSKNCPSFELDLQSKKQRFKPDVYSPLMKYVLAGEAYPPAALKDDIRPGIPNFRLELASQALSVAQLEAIKIASANPVSLVKGGPGTGKSHTISTLAVNLLASHMSVLVVSPTREALRVIEQKLVDDFAICPSLIGTVKDLKKTDELPARVNAAGDYVGSLISTADSSNSKVSAQSAIREYIHEFPTPSKQLVEGRGTLLERCQQFFLWRKRFLKPHEINNRVGVHLEALRNHQASHIHSVNKSLLANARHQLANYHEYGSKLQASNSSETPPFGSLGWGQIFKLWTAVTQDVATFGPCQFDYVIVDESSQINLAEMASILNAAKNIVVVGDEKQLKQYQFISQEDESKLAANLDLEKEEVSSFRNTSFLEYIDIYLRKTMQSDKIVELTDQFRSVPALIRFNNHMFYETTMTMWTDIETNNVDQHVYWQFHDGERKNGVNSTEVDAVVEFLIEAISQEKELLKKTTFGVVSFFSEQVNALKEEILRAIPTTDIAQHRIKVGTPYHFQGGQREHIILSCAIDAGTHRNAWRYLNREDVFNVATSRAKFYQTVICSLEPKSMPVDSLLSSYYEYCVADEPKKYSSTEIPSNERLIFEFEQRGFQVEKNLKLGHVCLDLVISNGKQRLAVNLIGFPGQKDEKFIITRYETLFRVGIPLYSISIVDWLLHKSAVFEDVDYWLTNKSSRLNIPSYSGRLKSSMESLDLEYLLGSDVAQRYLALKNDARLKTPIDFELIKLTDTLKLIHNKVGQTSAGKIELISHKSVVSKQVKLLLVNVENYLLLREQLWKPDGPSGSHWNDITQVIKEKHEHCVDELSTLASFSEKL